MTTPHSDAPRVDAPPFDAPSFDAIGFVVTDMARTLACYRLLGLDLPPEFDTEGHVEATLPSGLRLMWDTVDIVRSFDPDWSPPSGGHRVALAFGCDSPAHVDAVHDGLVAAGLTSHKAPWDAVWGQRYAMVLDPDGTPIDLFAPLPD